MSLFNDADLSVDAPRSRAPWAVLAVILTTVAVAVSLWFYSQHARAAQAEGAMPTRDELDFEKTAEGVEFAVIDKPAEPKKAQDGDVLLVHYRGALMDGRVFDSSIEPRPTSRKRYGEPIALRLGDGEVIPGWEIGLRGMSVGERRRLIIPPELAYGDKGAGDLIGPGETLDFQVELVGLYRPADDEVMPAPSQQSR